MCVTLLTLAVSDPALGTLLFRVVGRWQSERLHVLAVRPVSQDERKVYKLRINTCERALRASKREV